MNIKDVPEFQSFNLDGVKHISPAEAFELVSDNKVYFIDVREEEEFVKEYFDFEMVFFHPMSQILERIQYIPKNVSLIVVCNEGVRSAKVVNLLNRQGFTMVYNLDGGIQEWKIQGFPTVSNDGDSCDTDSCGSSCGSCGCGC
jgi:rhodanese-related sulfurtransferase